MRDTWQVHSDRLTIAFGGPVRTARDRSAEVTCPDNLDLHLGTEVARKLTGPFSGTSGGPALASLALSVAD